MTIMLSSRHSDLGTLLLTRKSKVFLELNNSHLRVLESRPRVPNHHNPTHLCKATLSHNLQAPRLLSKAILSRTRTIATHKANNSMATDLTTPSLSSIPPCSRPLLDLELHQALWRSNLQVSLKLRATPTAKDCIPKVVMTITSNIPTISSISSTNTRTVLVLGRVV